MNKEPFLMAVTQEEIESTYGGAVGFIVVGVILLLCLCYNEAY